MFACNITFTADLKGGIKNLHLPRQNRLEIYPIQKSRSLLWWNCWLATKSCMSTWNLCR